MSLPLYQVKSVLTGTEDRKTDITGGRTRKACLWTRFQKKDIRVKELTGAAFSTLHSGDIKADSGDENMSDGRIRREGAGHKSFVEHHTDVIDTIEKIIDG